MNISLVIPAFNEERDIGPCLESVLAQAAGRLREIIVVDNASTDRTAEIARGYRKVRTVWEPRKGLTSARQRGLQEASGDIVAFIDADARLPPHWLDTVKRVFDAHPSIVALTGPYRYHDGPKLRRWVLNAGAVPVLLIGKHLFGMMIVGGNFVARKQALEAMGGFDRTISFYGEDADVARRIKAHGKVVFRSDFFVYTSTRRYDAEGLLAPTARYYLNFLWVRFFHRPFSTSYRDIRSNRRADAR